jgi:ABC-type bacteriocin/lantibiotic exporter with double-glycine peptidase domain
MLRRNWIARVLLLSCCGVMFAAELTGVWLDVPFVKQEKDGCGAASIAMVMQYWQQQQKRSPNANAEYGYIQQALLSRAAHGVFASDMERYFQENGFTTFSFTGDWAALNHHLQKGRPLIVSLKPGSHLALHYVVVAGLNENEHVVLINDPAQRKLLKEESSRFEQEWKGAGHRTLLAVSEGSAH